MSSTFLGAVEISQPVLHSATSSRVSPALIGQNGHYSSTDDLINEQLAKKEQQFRQVSETETSTNRFQTKYASPDNLLVPNMAQISIASIEADALSGKAVPHTNGGGSAFSDTSSELSDTPLPSAPPNGTPGSVFVIPATDGISESDINQVELFYRSHKTEVRVCGSLANLYVSVPKIKDRASLALNVPEPQKIESKRGSKKSNTTPTEPTEYKPPPRSPEPADIRKDEWEFAKTGIPLLVLDTGDHIRERRLSIVLAERGTGFTLWSDAINHLTKYSTPHTNFHTLTLSTDSTRLVGLSFDEGSAATEFAEAVASLTANPDDDLLNLSSKKKKKKKEKKSKQKYKPPKKIDISQPCCFVHVTKLERPDYLGIPLLVFPPPPSGAELRQSTDNMTRALSQSSGISDVSTTPSSDHLDN